MEIKNDARIAADIAHGIKRAAGELKLSEVSCKTGTAPVEEECSRSYANGRKAVGNYGIFMIQLAENIKAISTGLEEADKNLI